MEVFILLTSILIVYGITNILVFGTIFDGIKTSFRNWIDKLKLKNESSFDDLSDLYNYKIKIKENSDKFRAFEEYQTSISITDNPSDSLITNFEKSRNTVLDIIRNYKHSKFRSFIIWISEKIDKLFQCMMCTGFWVGLIISILSYIFNIKLFGVNFILIEGSFSLIGVFLLSCMFSGTCWIINSFVDLLVVKKENIENNEEL